MKGSTLLWVIIGGGAVLTVYFMTRSQEAQYTGGGYPSGAPQSGGMWPNLADAIAATGTAIGGIVHGFEDDPKKDGNWMGQDKAPQWEEKGY